MKFCWHTFCYGRWIGCVYEYTDGADLTEKVAEWWLAHPSGDTPPFFLADVMKAMGDLWHQPTWERIRKK